MKPFSLSKYNLYPLIFLVTVAALITGIHISVSPSKQSEAYLPAVAAAAGFAYFLYNQHLQKTRLFTELFKQFNAKYDQLNESLNRIATDTELTVLSPDDRQVLFDYFNLCAEEYLYFKTGYIDGEVWHSWCKGMHQFSQIKHIHSLWESELAGDSYYGFTLELLKNDHV